MLGAVNVFVLAILKSKHLCIIFYIQTYIPTYSNAYSNQSLGNSEEFRKNLKPGSLFMPNATRM